MELIYLIIFFILYPFIILYGINKWMWKPLLQIFNNINENLYHIEFKLSEIVGEYQYWSRKNNNILKNIYKVLIGINNSYCNYLKYKTKEEK